MAETTQRRIKLSKAKKSLLGGKGLVKMIIPKLATMVINLISIGPRIILRSAFQILRTNIWTRLLSTLILVSFDLYSYARKKISRKQLIINLILSTSLLVGGTAGWMFGTNTALAVVAENTMLWIVAGIIGAGGLGSILNTICRKVLGRFMKSDVEDMLDFFNAEFELMGGELGLSSKEMDTLAAQIRIDDKICVNCFAKSNKKKYAREVLGTYFDRL
ncbi:MAG: hypothetical protein FWC93_07450 [Defluviitaleaceae bacterium]|nr:hypothetical protein [Defluviitaleaceae bacterium]